MKKILVEFIGTFFLVFTIGCAVASGSVVTALAIGSMLMCLVYAGAHISGANYNPAVSLSLFMRKALTMNEMLGYWGAQFAGGLVGALAACMITGNPNSCVHVPGPDVDALRAVMAEVLGTFALCWVVLNVATAKKNEGNSFYGLAIGMTVFACAIGLGGISGGAFNPAVGAGRNICDLICGAGTSIGGIWIYFVGPFLGGVLATLAYNFVAEE